MISQTPSQQKKARELEAYYRARKLRNKLIYDSVILEERWDLILNAFDLEYYGAHHALWEHQMAYNRELQLAPRGCGKSVVSTAISALVKILRNPNIRILFASDTVTHAQEILAQLKAFLTHPITTEIFGQQRGDTWNEDSIVVAGRTIPRREGTVITTGVDSSITGAHVDEIYCDDLVTLKNSRTEGERRKVFQWFYFTLMPCITDANTGIRVRGTPYNPDDLYAHLMKNDPFFIDSTNIIPALNPDTDESNIPERWSTQELRNMRSSMGRPAFNSQFNMDVRGIKGCLFDDKYFRHVDAFPKDLAVFSGVDLAISKKEESAQTAIVTIGICRRTYDIYVIKWVAGKWSPRRQDEEIVRNNDTYAPIRIGIEGSGYQASRSISLKEGEDTWHIPAIPIYPQDPKHVRFGRLSALFERGDIIFHSSERGGQLEDQLMQYPNGARCDIIDALEIAIYTARISRKRKEESDDTVPSRNTFRPMVRRRAIR